MLTRYLVSSSPLTTDASPTTQPPSDDTLRTTPIPEASNPANAPEVSYDSPVNNRQISANQVEAIAEDTQLQDLAKRDSVCKWDYVNDVNTRRVPGLLMKAECRTLNQPPTEKETRECQAVLFHVAVKKMDESGRWVDHLESLPVACVLANRAFDTQPARCPTEGEEDYGADVTVAPCDSTHERDPSEGQGDVSTPPSDSASARDQTENEGEYEN